jgi:hypothetical protein
MDIDFSREEIQLLEANSLLTSPARKKLSEYLHFLLYKQYKAEVLSAVVGNQFVVQMLNRLRQMAERNDLDMPAVSRKLHQLRELYFSIFSSIHVKYSELVPDLDSCEIVREFGVAGFDNIERACMMENKLLLRLEIEDFYRGFETLAQKSINNTRQLVAI